MANQASIISSDYCLPDSVNLQFNTKMGAVYNENGDVVFNVIKETFTRHKRRVLYDNKGKPIVTLYKKFKTMHGRWQVFEGKSDDLSKLLFSAKLSSKTQKKVRLDVFKANNEDESRCDFRVVIDENESTVYAGESPTPAAECESPPQKDQ
ncbi:LURP-one-related 15 [Spatholobus suberectus]|nr:LURP-one-related 15 [Spatholobus suberectus]